MLYCIEVTRELEEMAVLHKNFESEPSRQDILDYINDCDLNYNDDYGKLEYYRVA